MPVGPLRYSIVRLEQVMGFLDFFSAQPSFGGGHIVTRGVRRRHVYYSVRAQQPNVAPSSTKRGIGLDNAYFERLAKIYPRRRHKEGLFKPAADFLFGAANRPRVSTSLIPFMSRRRRYKKRRRGGSHTAYHLASQAMSKVRKLERKVEVKVFDHTSTDAAVGAAGVIRDLAFIPQGDLAATRDGNLISPFFMKLKIRWLGLAASVDEVIRTIVFRDKQQVLNTNPVVTDVLATATPMSMYNLTHRKRWKILFDATWTSPNDVAIRTSFIANTGMKLRLPMRYSGGAGGDKLSNGLYIIHVATATPTVVISTRLFYNDV